MSERLTTDGYLYIAETPGMERFPLKSEAELALIDGAFQRALKLDASDTEVYFELLETFNPAAVTGLRGLARAIEHIIALTNKEEVDSIPIAEITTVSDSNMGKARAYVGSMDVGAPLTPGIDKISLETHHTFSLRAAVNGSLRPIVGGWQNNVPSTEQGDGFKYNVHLDSIHFVRQEDGMQLPVHGFSDMIAVGSTVQPVLEVNGFEHLWARYAAGR